MTMKLKRIVLLIAVCLQALSLAAAPRIVRPGVKSPTTFAIFIDSRSYEAAAAEVDAYRAAVERDGLGTYLLIDEWQNPESVRSEIIRMTEAQPHLEGVVFVGDIPIAMIRDGQHLTSAFKSSQDRDWKDSSVPSDRYYDDPELQFEFLRRDADEPLYFYYSLSPESRQHIASPIYSARIKPPKREGADSDELLRAYLRKVVKAHAEQNELDNLFVFRGHGYNSEAPEAWAGEQIALREQLPALFRTGSTVRFYDFESRWPMKPYLLEKMARKGVDVALCHHHGAPDTQYLNGYRNGSGMNVSIENIKRFLRSKIDGHKDPEKRKAELIAYYGVPEAWCQLSDSLHTADSLLDQAMDDIHGIAVMLGNTKDIRTAIEKAIKENADLRGKVEEYVAERVENLAKECIAKARMVNGVRIMRLDGPRVPEVVKNIAFAIRRLDQEGHYVFVGATHNTQKPLLTLLISDDLVKEGLNAGQTVRQAAKLIKGGGGGQPFFAQAGGKDLDGLSAAADEIIRLLNLS